MKTLSPYGPVRRDLVGDNHPSATPGEDPAIYGTATLQPVTPVEARSFHTLKLVYVVGSLGLDDTGAIRIAWRLVSDSGRPQTVDPAVPNFVSATSSGDGRLQLKYDVNGGQRPWNETLTVYQRGGYLRQGDEITVIFGDTTGGSPGMLAQTFAEGGREFRIMADVQATGNFVELPDTQLAVPIVAGPPQSWHGVLPSLRRPGETFHFGIKAEDKWGNPTAQAKARLTLHPSVPVEGLPEELHYEPEDRAMTLEGLRVMEPGLLRIGIAIDGRTVAEAGPLVVREGEVAGYWGDLHGQTGETVGTNTVESYLDFARNKAFLDVTSHQANDFQITPDFWAHLNQLTAEYDEPGRFTVFPGYEWSGNTAVGGDHNVFFRHEGRPIRRCSHALLEDRSGIETDAHTLSDLFHAFRQTDEDVVVYAHVGGRYANIHYDHDPLFETAVEIHSAWGTFEWILTDGFDLGRRVGIVCNSDGHKGRPGASYPGASVFGAYGGLTCFLTEENDRDWIFKAQRRRHHYGTTGCRMHMDVRVALPQLSTLYERNPDAEPYTATYRTGSAMMGDIVKTDASEVELAVEICAHAGIERVEIRNGVRVLETIRPYTEADLGDRIRVLWSGAEYRGRGRNTNWGGRAQFSGTTISRFETINRWNPDMLLEQRGSDTVVWKSVTTGNFMGFDAWLSRRGGHLMVNTNHGNLSLDLDAVGLQDVVREAGGLDRKIRVFRLPDQELKRELTFRRTVPLKPTGDNPIWICVTTEDGFQAWSSPVYLFRQAG
ncbi:DUF3604 domain-containing protein [Hoeflea poritis]|uniref:DUF3604 domain-containing protein n=1 Tax=Hoeflea poritis TaxID=2993659 RepID=A0ABT4VLZ3_9HYPH|nr:DUF3604 domain-containing protein [Hoeflea poritis]MDA4845063.1 DUF3604 domain-containing protein [Hoeflea poritis]